MRRVRYAGVRLESIESPEDHPFVREARLEAVGWILLGLELDWGSYYFRETWQGGSSC